MKMNWMKMLEPFVKWTGGIFALLLGADFALKIFGAQWLAPVTGFIFGTMWLLVILMIAFIWFVIASLIAIAKA